MIGGDKHQAILTAAEQIFNQKGLQAAKVEEIAKLAGVAKGTVYLYFNSKQEIFLAVLKNLLEDYLKDMQQIAHGARGAEQKLVDIIRQQLCGIPRPMAFAFPELNRLDRLVYEELVAAQTTAQDTIAKVIDQGVSEGKFRQVDTNYAAFCLIGILRAHVDMTMLNRDIPGAAIPLEESIYKMFIEGLQK